MYKRCILRRVRLAYPPGNRSGTVPLRASDASINRSLRASVSHRDLCTAPLNARPEPGRGRGESAALTARLIIRFDTGVTPPTMCGCVAVR